VARDGPPDASRCLIIQLTIMVTAVTVIFATMAGLII